MGNSKTGKQQPRVTQKRRGVDLSKFQSATCEHCAGTGKAINHKIIGKTMKKLRDKANPKVSLRQMAKATKYSAAYICALEAGGRDWNPDLVTTFLSALDREPKDFYRVANGLSSTT